MARKTTPSFVLELPLIVSSQSERELKARFNAGMRLYNDLLGEAEARRKAMQKSELYQLAKAIRPLTVVATSGKNKGKRVPNPKRTEAFSVAAKAFQYREYDLHAYATIAANSAKWIAEKVDSNTQQKLATRAFKASERIIFTSARSVRFKVPNRFKSMEGKSNRTGIRWKNNRFVWGKLVLDAIIDWSNPVIIHALKNPVKYCRIIRRELNGKIRWFVQLVLEGLPYAKPKNYVRNGEVGIDLNVSNVAFVTNEAAGLLPFAEKVPTYEKEIKRLQRKMNRSIRQSNPDNFEPDFTARRGMKTVVKQGKVKKGAKQWIKTQNYLKLAATKRELERRKAAYSKSQNRKLVNDILRHGSTIKTENVSVKGWQKLWGKAIAAKSPGFFQSELKRKAESAGGSFTKFSTRTTACSQTHLDGKRRKKSLSQRVHNDVTGVVMHRDLMSAFLSLQVSDDLLPSAEILQREYRRVETHLLQAWQCYKSTSLSK